MDRTQPVGITLSRETRAPHTAIAGRAKLPGLNVERALKGGQLQASTPELDERQARLRENQSLNLVHWRKMLPAVVTRVSCSEPETEIGIGFFGILGQAEGNGRQRGQYRWEYGDDRCKVC